jgi:hypothetical protein
MNRLNTIVLCLASVAVVTASCGSQDGPNPGGPGATTGSTSSTTGAATGSGDTTSGSGSGTTGNGTTSAAATSSTAATTSSGAGGGSTTSGAGGATGAGGDPTTSTTSGGGSGGAATTTAGGAGGAGTGGAGGSGTGGAGGGSVTPADIVPTLDGFLWVGECSDAMGAGKDCPINSQNSASCVTNNNFFARGAFQIHTHKVGGVTGQKYMINMEVRGITGGKEYTGGTRQSTDTTFNQMANDGWRVGGLPTDSKWNTYEVHVSPPVPGQPVNNQALTCTGCPQGGDNVYFTNSIPNTDGVHETFPIKFKASFPVLGGGTIQLIIHDSNCLAQQNCGPDPDPNAMCTEPPPNGPRTIDLAGLSPLPPNFVQPYTQVHAPNPWYPQWLLFDVQTVTKM